MPALPDTQQSLLVRLRTADQQTAWETFLDIYEPAIVRFAISRGLQDADARDVAQEVLLAVHAKVDQWEPNAARGSFRSWLFQVTRNLSAKHLRQRGTQPELNAGDALAEIAANDEQEASAFVLEYRREVFRWAAKSVRDQFAESSWEAFRRTSVEGEVTSQVAMELGITVGAVYAAKCRIMSHIREVVDQMTSDEFV